MRIISGSAGGIPIQVPKTLLRPTADRVREAVFSMLGEEVEGAAVLDLFAGSGSYGLECLSRGAKSCVFVESDRSAGPVITANLKKAGLGGGTVAGAPVESWLKGRAGAFNLIFADPPFKKQKTDRDWDALLLESTDLRGLLVPGGIFVLESFARAAHPPPPDSPWHLAVERRYGDVAVRLFSLPAAASPSPPSPLPDAPAPGSAHL
ncbi:MAG: s-adenosyl-l-methionine-dependent methyltransferase [Verrucomicrobiales bacterium]|nr:s-adenosyl-l-methionine-dependent methyltransferase [Verrucomicrobiales bacterium]